MDLGSAEPFHSPKDQPATLDPPLALDPRCGPRWTAPGADDSTPKIVQKNQWIPLVQRPLKEPRLGNRESER